MFSLKHVLVVVVGLIAGTSGAFAVDAIVGSWTGTVKQDEETVFETRLTFVSPMGGVSRYPSFPCGGVLSGGPKGTAYEYSETITWGGPDEKEPGCIPGQVRLSIKGDTMQYEWSGMHNGEQYEAHGQLQRIKGH